MAETKSTSGHTAFPLSWRDFGNVQFYCESIQPLPLGQSCHILGVCRWEFAAEAEEWAENRSYETFVVINLDIVTMMILCCHFLSMFVVIRLFLVCCLSIPRF